MSWLTGWSYRRSVTVTNSAGEAATDYPIKLVLTSTDFDFSKFLANGNDLRVTDSDGSTVLSYWIEKWEILYEGVVWVWVKIPGTVSSGGGTRTLYIYYGNASASDAADITTVFTFGCDFTGGNTTGLTINTAGTASVSVPSQATQFGIETGQHAMSRSLKNPTFQNAGAGWDNQAVRDFALLTDESGNLVRESGNLIAYYSGRNSVDGKLQIGRATSSDGWTWTRDGSNPLITYGTAGAWDDDNIAHGRAIKLNNGTYILYYSGRRASDDRAAIGIATSNDGISWTKHGSNPVLIPTSFGLASGDDLSVPWVVKLSDGTWAMLLEGADDASTTWKIYLATSSDGLSWSAGNSGSPVLTVGSGGTWDDGGVANPKLVEVAANQYMMMYNGHDGAFGWDVSLAFSTDLVSWTRISGPHLQDVDGGSGATWQSDAVETSDFPKEAISKAREAIKFHYQGFATYSTISDVGIGYLLQRRLLDADGQTATTDGWTIGRNISSDFGTGKFEIRISAREKPKSGVNGSSLMFGIFDDTTAFSPATAATVNPKRRVVVFRRGWNMPTPADASKFFPTYLDTSNVLQRWTGSGWSTSTTLFGGPGKATIVLKYDGTNYLLNVLDDRAATVITAEASIAASSVKAFTNSKIFSMGEPFNDAEAAGQYVDWLFFKKLIDTEPSQGSWSQEEIFPAQQAISLSDYLMLRDPLCSDDVVF